MNAMENVPIPEDTVNAVRSLLLQRGEKDMNLPEFINQILRREIFHQTVAEVKLHNADVDTDLLDQEINDAVKWSRENRP